MGKRVVLMVAAWLAGAAAAAVGVMAALSFLGTGLFGASSPPMSQATVIKKLAVINSRAGGSPSPSPTTTGPTPSTGPSAPPQATGSRSTSGGMVYATCSAGLVQIRSAPRLNYVADDLATGPARSAWVTFTATSGSAEVHVTATCAGGKPVFTTASDDHGGAVPTGTAPTGTAPTGTAPPSGGGDDHGGGRGGGGSGGGKGGGGGGGGGSGGGAGGGGGGHDG